MSRPPINIAVYNYHKASGPVGPARAGGLSVRADRAIRGVMAASVCLLAHGLLFHDLIWTAGAPASTPKDLPARISVSSASDQEAMQWIAIDPNALTDPSRQKSELPSAHLTRIDVPKELTEVAVLVEDVDLPPTPDATVADAGRLSKMYGRYVGQISSRIERAWMRPRTPIGAPLFSCEVKILQDARGNVMEVTLVSCNGDSRWQLSLVQAIQSASPLPAPPDPDVFSRTVHVAFSAEAYSPQSPVDQYEPAATALVARATQDAQRADEALAHFADSRGSGAVRLSITGGSKSVEFTDSATAGKHSAGDGQQQ